MSPFLYRWFALTKDHLCSSILLRVDAEPVPREELSKQTPPKTHLFRQIIIHFNKVLYFRFLLLF